MDNKNSRFIFELTDKMKLELREKAYKLGYPSVASLLRHLIGSGLQKYEKPYKKKVRDIY